MSKILKAAIAAITVVVAIAGAALGLYGTGPLGRNGGECGDARLGDLARLARGEVAAFEVTNSRDGGGLARELAQSLTFDGPDGARRSVADFRGRAVLLNLWATWCEPCKREMPALDRLQAELGGSRFEVVAVNVDTRNLDRPKAWLTEAGIRSLAYYSDREAKVFQTLRRAGLAEGMPTTLLFDAKGCRLGRVSGPAEWASPEGLALIRAALPPAS